MNVLQILQRRRALRWLVPAGVAGVAAIVATGVLTSGGAGSASLPAMSPAALLAQVRNTDVTSFSGTIVTHVALGLPEIPEFGGAGDSETALSSLLSGSHTLQVWYGGVDQQRIALLGATDETDVFHDGRNVWQWSSAKHTAVHFVLPADDDAHPVSTATTLTPAELARRAIAEVNPTTRVTVGPTHSVADRAVYDLVLTPRAGASKVGSVHIEVDGTTKVPLGVQVYPRSSSDAAIDVGFTSIHFGAQSARNFEFTPPPDATVHSSGGGSGGAAPASRALPKQSGSGWTQVVSFPASKRTIDTFAHGIVAKAATSVSGAWGKGRLIDSALLSVLVTSDGRVFAGAVDPTILYAAAAK